MDLKPVDNLNTNELLLTLEEKINNLKYEGRLEQAVKEDIAFCLLPVRLSDSHPMLPVNV